MRLFLLFVLLSVATNPQDDASAPAILGVSFSDKPQFELFDRNARWMAALPDAASLAELSLPGTHDSGARFDGLSFGFAKCQSWSIADQLVVGIRFLDVRCRHFRDEFHIYHGVVDQKLTFKQVIRDCAEFLENHPSECIVMAVKQESSPRENTRSFQETFAAAIQAQQSVWWRGSEIPTLKEVRGKIVLLDRVGSLGGLPWKSLQKQDRYTVPVAEKQELILKQFEATTADKSGIWFLNYCSGTVPAKLLTPRKYAALTNQFTLQLIDGFPRYQHLGTVVMDFPSETLIDRIINANRLEPEQ